MLNCCIERKRARDEAHREGGKDRGRGPASFRAGSTSTKEVPQGKFRDSGSDSEDEFFECLSDQEEVEEGGKDGGKGRAEGRLHPYNNMTLLNSTEPLYVPITQVEHLASPTH